MVKTFKKFVEDGGGGAGGGAGAAAGAPTNNAGGGQIAGIGVGPHGEPGVDPNKERKRRKYKSG